MQRLYLLLSFSAIPAVAEVAMWQQPDLLPRALTGRAGYSPEYNSCGGGDSCGTCGDGFQRCKASTDSVLFCYDPTVGQTCCPNGQGKACDQGYYCAEDNGGRTWCCPNDLNLEQCASSYNVPQLASIVSSSSSTTKDPETVTETITVSPAGITSPSSSIVVVSSTVPVNGSAANYTYPVIAGQAKVAVSGINPTIVGIGLLSLLIAWMS